MKRSCPDCRTEYDDVERLTICPHKLLMRPRDLKRKHDAMALLGKKVVWAHNNEPVEIIAVTFVGMVMVKGKEGESFAPYCFKEAA